MFKKLLPFLAALALMGPVLGAPMLAHAVISSPTVTVTATGNSVTTLWNYGFIIPYQANGVTPAVTVSTTTAGVTTVISPSLYTITGINNPSGGTVHYPLTGSPLTSATAITITRSLAYIQPTAVPNAAFLPHTVEQVADNLDMQIQQLAALGGGGGGGACVTTCVNSFNTRTGDVTLLGADVTTALGYTPLSSANILAGSGINVSTGGGNVTISNTGSGTGTVTSVATDTSLTGGPITTTGTLSRAALTGDITASGGSNATTLATVNSNVGTFGSTTQVPSFTVNGKGLITAATNVGMSAVLDATFGSARGDVLYRNGTVWTVLTPGTSGQFLQTLGAGADPAWATAGGGGSGCTVSGGAQFQILVNDGASGCSSSANGTVTIGALALGQSGTLGTVSLGNATSGTIKLQPVAGALGTTVLTLPAGSDTLAAIAATQTLTNKSISGSANTLSNIALASLATQATNTVLVNATSGSASPTAQTVSSCSGAANALTWTTNTGFGCNTIASSGAGTLANIAALRALTVVTPASNVVLGYTTAGKGGGTFTYVASDTTTADNSCTIFVDAASHRWYRNFSGAVDVRYCGALGDGSTDDVTALRAALAVGPAVFIAPSTTCYITSNTLTVSAGQSVYGTGPATSCIKASTAANAIFIVPVHADTTNSNFSVTDMLLDRSIAATAGGDGIGFTSYVNNATLSNLLIRNQYNGISVMSTDKSTMSNITTYQNYNIGVLMTSSNWYPTMQWNLFDVFSTNNESDGFRATTATNSYGSPCASMGTWANLATFANNGYGANFIGISATYCMEGVRITGGFFGQDANDEIHLDTYNSGGGSNAIQPQYAELAGTSATGRTGSHAATNVGSGIYLSTNVGPSIVSCGICNGNSADGLATFANMLQVTGGNYTNNGQASIATRRVGINVLGGNARGTSIGAVTAGNTAGSSQQYGIALVGGGDLVSVGGANLLNNGVAATTGMGCTNCFISGVLPIASNTAPSGAYCLLTGCTISGTLTVTTDLVSNGQTHLNGATAFNDNITFAAGKQFTGGAGSGLTVDNLRAAVSGAVGTTASGVAGRLDTTSLVASGAISGTTGTFSSAVSGTTGTFSGAVSGTTLASSGLATLNSLSVTNAASMNGGLTMVGSSGITGTSSGITMQDGAFTRSVGIGTGASGTTGRLDTSADIIGGRDVRVARSLGVGVNASGTAGYGTFNDTVIAGAGSFSVGIIAGFVSASGDVASATLHVSGASALHGTTVVSGGLAVTTGGLTADNISTAGGLAVGTPTGGVLGAGTINAATSVNLNNNPYTNP